MYAFNVISLAHMGGVKMFSMSNLKIAGGIAVGIAAYFMFIKPSVPFLK